MRRPATSLSLLAALSGLGSCTTNNCIVSLVFIGILLTCGKKAEYPSNTYLAMPGGSSRFQERVGLESSYFPWEHSNIQRSSTHGKSGR